MGAKAAFQFGAEYQANPGSSRMEYLDDAAKDFREGVETIADLSADEKKACFAEFNRGVETEKSLQ
jgi:hypothetical protein